MAYENRYAGVCCRCGGRVEAGEGFYIGGQVYHAEGDCDGGGLDYSHVSPDEYQQAVLDGIASGILGPHVLVNACAGSGKTTIGCMGLTQLHETHPDISLAAFAFGNEDGKRLRASLPSGVEARTHHSLCMAVIRKVYGVKHCQSKVTTLLDDIVGQSDEFAFLRDQVRSLLAMVQADAVAPGDVDGIRETLHSDCYDFCVTEDEEERVIELTARVLEESMDVKKHGFTFDDALYLCAVRSLPLPSADVILVDEIQDWNNCQLAILEKWVSGGARVIGIGDPNQSLYGFRGAQPDAFDRVKSILSTGRGVSELPMPVCRRSAKDIVSYAAEIVPEIQALPDAPQGELRLSVPIDTMLEQLKPGEDMVLSRTNARLVQLMYACIRRGISAHMLKGEREAGFLQWLVDMLAKNPGGGSITDAGELMNRAQAWLEERANVTSAYKLEEHRGRVEVLSIICQKAFTVKDIKAEIKTLFARPPKGKKTIVLSTIHSAKGSESQRVWNISRDLMPHPRAKSDNQKKQEQNAIYVCRTRPKEAYFETTGELSTA